MPIPEVTLRLDATGIDVGRVMAQFEEDTEFSGLVDLSIHLESAGRSMDALRAAVSGHARGVLRGGTAASKLGRRFTVDLASLVFPELRTREVPRIGCAIADFAIEDGEARVQTLLLREGEITVTGTGEIDLAEGVYHLRLTPSTTNPAILSVTPEVRVRGPLGDPEFRAVKRTLASSLIVGLGENARKAGMALLLPFGSRRATIERSEEACELVGVEQAVSLEAASDDPEPQQDPAAPASGPS
jgi:uncharacterized protein involved in outer membrane biogenesis